MASQAKVFTVMIVQIKDLIQSLGTWVNNHNGVVLGKLVDIKCNFASDMPEYLILCCHSLPGDQNRYFAIPARPPFVTMGEQGKVTVRIDKAILQVVMGVHVKKCPRLDRQISDSIFEIYEYENNKF